MAKKTKQCSKCGETKDVGEFNKHAGTSDGRQSWCKSCFCAARAKQRISAPDKARVHWIRWKYGISAEEYGVYLAEPCAICGADSEHLDHNHRTGEVRAALCRGCNHGLGNFDDRPERLRNAADYLELHG